MKREEMKRQMKLKVADIIIEARATQENVGLWLAGPHEKFLVEEGSHDTLLRIVYGDIPQVDMGKRLFATDGVWNLYARDRKYYIPFVSPTTGPTPYRLVVLDEDFQEGHLFVRPRTDLAEEFGAGHVAICPFEYPLDELIMVNLLARGRGLNIHACGVGWHSRGLAFCGASGAGKSTLARLFAERGVPVLSDDRLILRRQDGALWIHGTPWHGDASASLAEKASLEKLYFLRHAPANEIVPLSPGEAVKRLLTCCFPPFYYAPGMEYTLSFMAQLTQEIPCYELGFVPDDSAVELVLKL
ncbi:MAG TPA: hypothetical protein VJ565_03070 [Dehalococcoidia bacterium]|nr:hypothetical protein [Dehalococcoidia bacterium]